MSYLAKRLRMAAGIRSYREVVLGDSPYAYWPLTETAGTVAADLSANALVGVYQQGAQLAAQSLLPSEPSGRYVKLTGTAGSFVDISTAIGFCAGPSWSIECWVNVASYEQQALYAIYKGATFVSGLEGGAPAQTFCVRKTANASPFLWYSTDAANGVNGDPPPTIGSPAHVVFTVEKVNRAALYLNGLRVGSTLSLAPGGRPTKLAIGRVSVWAGEMNGVIGEVALYDKALTPNQIAMHFEAGMT